MDEQFDALRKAFGEAGIEVPNDPTALPLEALDEQVTDRRLRGACKSALVKFKRAADASGWSPAGSEAPPESDAELVEAPEAMVESTVAEPTPSADQPKRPTITEPVATAAAPVTADAAPMSPELSARYEAMEASFAAAAAPLPDDPLTFDLNSLDSMDDDKKQRGQVKSALMKFVKLAKDEGWAAVVAPAAAVSEPVLPPPQAAMEPPAEEPTPS
ncbi:MAG: hypothetical protein HUU35_16830, partial [Armatimonadetes bacterium]|nr:hypothetical protein [Armatimonadota bacterium]